MSGCVEQEKDWLLSFQESSDFLFQSFLKPRFTSHVSTVVLSGIFLYLFSLNLAHGIPPWKNHLQSVTLYLLRSSVKGCGQKTPHETNFFIWWKSSAWGHYPQCPPYIFPIAFVLHIIREWSLLYSLAAARNLGGRDGAHMHL